MEAKGIAERLIQFINSEILDSSPSYSELDEGHKYRIHLYLDMAFKEGYNRRLQLIKISRTEAYQAMDEIDLKVMDQELDLIFNSDQRQGKEMTHQFFLDKTNSMIILEVYWNDAIVQIINFKTKVN